MKNSNQLPPEDSQEESIDISEVLKVLLVNKRWLALFLAIGIFVSLFYALWSRPVYKTDTLIQLDMSKHPSTVMNSMGAMAGLFETANPAVTEIELITSRSVLMDVVESQGLRFYATPTGFINRLLQREGRLRISDLYIPEVARTEKWTAETISETEYELKDGYNNSILKGIVGETYRVPYAGDTLRIRASILRGPVGQKFAIGEIHLLTATRALRNSLNIAEKGKQSGIISISLENRYPGNASRILNAITQTYLKQNIEMRNEEAKQTLNFLGKQLPNVKARLDSAEKALGAFRHKEGTIDLSGETQIVLQKQVDFQKQILALDRQKQENLRLFKEDHPSIQVIAQQQEQLQKEIAKLNAQAKTLPLTQQEYLSLEQNVAINNSIYTSILNSIQQLSVVQAGENGNVRIVDSAQVELKPIKPRRKVILLAGVFGGFALGVGFVFLRRILNKGVRSSTEIERETGISVYAKVPEHKGSHKKSKDHLELIVENEPNAPTSEALRVLRSALEFSLKGNVLMITGLSPNAGKSFVSNNLAILFKGLGKRVLLIDADLRNSLHSRKIKGLTELLHNKKTWEEVVAPYGKTGIDFLPPGRIPVNPSELLASPKFKQIIDRARESYDLVIVDTAPVMLVTDALIISQYADFSLIVLHYGTHSIEEIQEALKNLSISSPDKDKAFVFNRCVYDGSKNGYGYNYGYGYGNGYVNKK
ncbi:MAG: polysaccharide biosynthesis tyrosine autokinase [Fibrobacter sp.]|jgi:tyrosine-protein kinase Etk/Wzc|nr:polysaccharide biosynthesis tyrosine autokinase [Fibrobacter sp.]